MMNRMRLPKTNWLEQAWELSNMFISMPDAPPGVPKLGPLRFITAEQRSALKALRHEIVRHLMVRMLKYYKIFPIIEGKRGGYAFTYERPEELLNAYREVAQMGAHYTKGDLWAIDAQVKISAILLDGWVCPQWKRELPLIVASIGGEVASRVAAAAAEQPRPRRQDLREAKADALSKHPDANWKELLSILEGMGVVEYWDPDSGLISWIDESGHPQKTKVKTFKNWKKSDSKAKSRIAS